MKNEKSPTDPKTWMFVEVVWHDALSDNSWRTPEKIQGLVRIVIRGWLIKKDRTSITVAATYGEEHNADEVEVNQILSIPRGWLESITKIDIKPTRKVSLRTLK